MLAVKFLGQSKVEVIDVPMPALLPGEVLLKVEASAICGSEMGAFRSPDSVPDVRDWAGREAYNVGHELTGVVVENPTGLGPHVGDRVAINIITSEEGMRYFHAADRRFFPDQGYVMGAHAEYIAVPYYTCMPLPDDIPFDLGVLLGGDTLGVAYHAFAKVKPAPRDVVSVVGVGPVGLGFVAMLDYFGLETIVVEPSAYRRQLVQAYGVAHVIDPTTTDPVEAVKDITHGRGTDISIDSSGKDAGVNIALNLTRKQGTFIFAGAGREAHINPWKHFLEKEIVAYGVWYFVDADYTGILAAYRDGLRVQEMLTHRFHLPQAQTAYDLMAAAQMGKGIFVPQTTPIGAA
jgi:threonine dehydrogenase-like Zn-dependent dehydrogenase